MILAHLTTTERDWILLGLKLAVNGMRTDDARRGGHLLLIEKLSHAPDLDRKRSPSDREAALSPSLAERP